MKINKIIATSPCHILFSLFLFVMRVRMWVDNTWPMCCVAIIGSWPIIGNNWPAGMQMHQSQQVILAMASDKGYLNRYDTKTSYGVLQ